MSVEGREKVQDFERKGNSSDETGNVILLEAHLPVRSPTYFSLLDPSRHYSSDYRVEVSLVTSGNHRVPDW